MLQAILLSSWLKMGASNEYRLSGGPRHLYRSHCQHVIQSKARGVARVRPNHSVELRANGMPPGPRYSAGVHYL